MRALGLKHCASSASTKVAGEGAGVSPAARRAAETIYTEGGMGAIINLWRTRGLDDPGQHLLCSCVLPHRMVSEKELLAYLQRQLLTVTKNHNIKRIAGCQLLPRRLGVWEARFQSVMLPLS
jgi:hypothetical protein